MDVAIPALIFMYFAASTMGFEVADWIAEQHKKRLQSDRAYRAFFERIQASIKERRAAKRALASAAWLEEMERNSWNGLAQELTAEVRQAILEALVLAARFDGKVTDGEKRSLSEGARELAEACGVAEDVLVAELRAVEARVDAALTPRSLRENPDAARMRGTEALVEQIATRIADPSVRELLFRTIERMARTKNSPRDADALVALFSAGLGVEST